MSSESTESAGARGSAGPGSTERTESAALEATELTVHYPNAPEPALDSVTMIVPRGSFYAFPSVQSTSLDSKTFATGLLKSENVAAVPGGAFGNCGEGFLRCCFATSFEQIEQAIERMARFVANTKKG